MTTDRFYTSPDGLRLQFRDLPGRPERPPIILLHGLTRNPRDFDGLAPWLQARGHRVIVPAMRGRGDSAWAEDAKTYALPHYAADLDRLWEDAALGPAIFIGTSMGGLLTMLIAAAKPGRVLGAALNDIGPQIEAAGLMRIAGYVGRIGPFVSWDAAAQAIADKEGDAFPRYTHQDWLLHARRRGRERDGAIVWDYDPRIADGFSTEPDGYAEALWRAFDALKSVPVLSIHGARSDLLSQAGVKAMADRHPGLTTATVPDAGHAPSLDEPEARTAIGRLLDAVAGAR